jgi:hypothetical protein
VLRCVVNHSHYAEPQKGRLLQQVHSSHFVALSLAHVGSIVHPSAPFYAFFSLRGRPLAIPLRNRSTIFSSSGSLRIFFHAAGP